LITILLTIDNHDLPEGINHFNPKTWFKPSRPPMQPRKPTMKLEKARCRFRGSPAAVLENFFFKGTIGNSKNVQKPLWKSLIWGNHGFFEGKTYILTSFFWKRDHGFYFTQNHVVWESSLLNMKVTTFFVPSFSFDQRVRWRRRGWGRRWRSWYGGWTTPAGDMISITSGYVKHSYWKWP
jgi:hypothetical protein